MKMYGGQNINQTNKKYKIRTSEKAIIQPRVDDRKTDR